MYDKEYAKGGYQGKGWDLLERHQFISAWLWVYFWEGGVGRWVAKEGDGWLCREIGGKVGRWAAK